MFSFQIPVVVRKKDGSVEKYSVPRYNRFLSTFVKKVVRKPHRMVVSA